MLAPVSLRLAGLSGSVLHVMSRAQLREFMALFVIGSALTVAMFFLALWLMPEAAIYPFSFAAISLSRRLWLMTRCLRLHPQINPHRWPTLLCLCLAPSRVRDFLAYLGGRWWRRRQPRKQAIENAADPLVFPQL